MAHVTHVHEHSIGGVFISHRQARRGDHAGSEASVGVCKARSLNPVISIV
jgi:hypothetical protein